MYIRRLSCLREKKKLVRFYSQLSYSSAQLFSARFFNLTVLITASGFVSNSYQDLNHLITSSECVHIMSLVLGQHKVSEERSSLEKYVEYN